MEILFSDSQIVICIKPAGVLSAKDSSGKTNMQDLLAQELNLSEIYPIHRLDREVSGVMVYGLSKSAAAKLSEQVSDHSRFVKEYLAVIEGVPEQSEGIFTDLLFKDSSKNKTFVVKKERRGVKKAKLEYKVVSSTESLALVRVRLHTGRTHQIRVQFASRKMPILGDRKYGGSPCEDGIQLFSVKLAFDHPISGARLDFEKIPNSVLLK
jgi:23S rRNA pseudouridine1911/1915/1917 synthase